MQRILCGGSRWCVHFLCRLETPMLSCTIGFWEWPFLEQQHVWLTWTDQTCTENEYIHTLFSSIEVNILAFAPPSLSLKVYSQCRRCSGSVGGPGRGWLFQRPHTLQWPQCSEWWRGGSDTGWTSSIREKDSHTTGRYLSVYPFSHHGCIWASINPLLIYVFGFCFVCFFYYQDRLLGLLMPFRAFGDVKFKWSIELQKRVLESGPDQLHENEHTKFIPPNYHTPPYLTAEPEITYHKLRPQDRFLVRGHTNSFM